MRVIAAILILLALIWFNLSAGSTGWISWTLSDISSQSKHADILWNFRLPAILTAISSGIALALAGLMMQVLFQNPLAGPGVLGVSSGAGLLISGGILLGIGSHVMTPLLGLVGALGVLLLLIIVAERVRNNLSLLIFGLMIGFLVSALVMVFQLSAEALRLQSFVYWTMGSFETCTWSDLKLLLPFLILLFIATIFLIPQLDRLLLGEARASALGYNIRRWRRGLLVVIGLLVGLVTAYCGPLAFIGLVAPHIARMFTSQDTHRHLLPYTALVGALLALMALAVSASPWIPIAIPLNAVLSLFGAPVVIYMLVRSSKLNLR